MDPKTSTKQRGLRMAMRVAALSVGAGGVAMAFAASPANASDASAAAPEAAAQALGAGDADASLGSTGPYKVTGWSCWGPVSRGPLAPPAQAVDDFEALLAEVPS